MLQASLDIHCMRTKLRGLRVRLNEIAASSRVGFRIYEDRIPLQNGMKALRNFDFTRCTSPTRVS